MDITRKAGPRHHDDDPAAGSGPTDEGADSRVRSAAGDAAGASEHRPRVAYIDDELDDEDLTGYVPV